MRIARAQIAPALSCFGRIDGERFWVWTGSPFSDSPDAAHETGESLPLSAVQLLAPCQPTKIVGVGRNYVAHAAEHGAEVPKEPLIFLKPPSSVIGPGDAIVLTPLSQQVEHESELVVVIGQPARRLRRENALDCVLGYTCGNDVTARDLQRRDGQWSRAKGFDTFCPLGPWIETELDLSSQVVSCRVNGELRQQAGLGDMVFDVAHLLVTISAVMTLLPGDVVMTGTPSGVGPLRAGDQVEVGVSGIGVLRTPVQGPE